MRKISIVGAATAAIAASLSGVGRLIADEPASPPPRPQNGVTWGRGRLLIKRAKEEKRQLTNDERRHLGLPHDGAKQAEKDRRRGYYNEDYFDAVNLRTLSYNKRAAPIVCRSDGRP